MTAPDRSDRDFEAEQARHQRRMQLMRMQGDTNRLETRMYICYAKPKGALANRFSGLEI